MLFENISILTPNFTISKNEFVAVKDTKIVYIGDSLPAGDFGETYCGTGKLLMPGLYNIHSHAPMTLMRGYAESLPLQNWLNNEIFPFEAHIKPYDVYAPTQLAIAEMLRFGTVGFTDMYFHTQSIAEAVIDSGIKANISQSIICFDDSNLQDLPAFQEMLGLYPRYNNTASGRLRYDMCIHAEYTNTRKIMEQAGQWAQEHNARTHIHISETKAEHDECVARHGITPVALAMECGLLESGATLAHCVHITPDDECIIASSGATVAHNPTSNLKLKSGIAPVAEMLSAGVNVGLGTDSVASNNNLNLFKEMSLMGVLHDASKEGTAVVTPSKCLYAATRGGALAQGRENSGCIAVGFDADLIVLDIDTPWMKPATQDMATHIVHSAQGSDVVLTMVDGVVLYRDGHWPTIDVNAVAQATEQSRNRIILELQES